MLKCLLTERQFSCKSPVAAEMGTRVLGGEEDRKAVSKDPRGLELLPGADQGSNTLKKANK